MNKIFPKKEPRIPFTQEGYDNLLTERAKLLSERPDAVEHLRLARGMGDLSENGYYKASRQRLSFLDSRIRRVERLLKLAVIVQSNNSGVVDIGSHVTISDGTKEYAYEVVGGYESDPSKHSVSHVSPIGRALIDKKAGDEITVHAPSGDKHFTIVMVH